MVKHYVPASRIQTNLYSVLSSNCREESIQTPIDKPDQQQNTTVSVFVNRRTGNMSKVYGSIGRTVSLVWELQAS